MWPSLHSHCHHTSIHQFNIYLETNIDSQYSSVGNIAFKRINTICYKGFIVLSRTSLFCAWTTTFILCFYSPSPPNPCLTATSELPFWNHIWIVLRSMSGWRLLTNILRVWWPQLFFTAELHSSSHFTSCSCHCWNTEPSAASRIGRDGVLHVSLVILHLLCLIFYPPISIWKPSTRVCEGSCFCHQHSLHLIYTRGHL